MSWGSDESQYMGLFIDELQEHVTSKKRRKLIYSSLIPKFQNLGWQDENDCAGMDDAYDEALLELDFYGLPEEA